MNFIAQAFGILGMTMNCVSYQAKKQRDIIIFQFFGSVLLLPICLCWEKLWADF